MIKIALTFSVDIYQSTAWNYPIDGDSCKGEENRYLWVFRLVYD